MNNQAKVLTDLLIDKGLVSIENIVNNDYQIMDVSRRNQNYLIECADSDGYFVKQVKSSNSQAIMSFQREAAVHWLAQNDPDFHSLTSVSPHCRGYDPQQNLLVMDLIKEAKTLAELLQQGLSDLQAAQLGQLLALTHRHTGRQTLQENKASPFAKNTPWILDLPGMQIAQLSQLSEGCRQLISLVQATPQLCALLAGVKSAWRMTSFIHGDLKPDNCLILNEPDNSQWPIRFIDWELADFGDPAWDIAALLQGIWIPYLQQNGNGAVDSMLNCLYPIQSQTRCLLQSYLANSETPAHEWPDKQLGIVQFTAARMIQSAYEMLHQSAVVETHVLPILQASCLIYAHPQALAGLTGSRT